jgi:hypothetical protein
MVVAALVVLIVVIALLWLVVGRWLRDGGVSVRAALEEDASIGKWSAEHERGEGTAAAQDARLDRAKDRNVAQTWGPGL